MIDIDESIVWNKSHALDQALQGNPLWPHSVAIRYNRHKNFLYASPTCDFPGPCQDNQDQYDACYTRKISHLDIKLMHTANINEYIKIFQKINFNGNSVYLHISNSSDLKKYVPVIRQQPLVLEIIKYFHKNFTNLYIELSNKTWNSAQFYGFRYIVKADIPNWKKVLNNYKKIKEFGIVEEVPKKPNSVTPLVGFKDTYTTLAFKDNNNNLVSILKY